ncbi:MAG: asparagine synthase (glutamine-hydrolyzing) [Planctomycetota bacterium]
MCGFLGAIGPRLPDDAAIIAGREMMRHRGPDDAGLWRCDDAVLGHRRLAVIDPGPSGHQPMVSDDGLAALAYNGELYNDAELRGSLGVPVRSGCDTATLLAWLGSGGALSRLRGMFAFASVDRRAGTLTLARDPLGIKPLYVVRGAGYLAFSSEIPPLFALPGIEPEPDALGVSTYLSTIRTVLAERTMFEGVRAVRPGEVLTYRLAAWDAAPSVQTLRVDAADHDADDPELRHTITESIDRHLRTDVPLCAMLSGGLDSTIIASRAAERVGSLRTYCAGVDEPGSDSVYAREVAAELGTVHRHVGLDGPVFNAEWRRLVHESGMPLSTPNEVAIRLVARAMRRDGAVVTLSGEGADELFAGYDLPLRLAADHEAAGGDPGLFQLDAHAWVGSDAKAAVLAEGLREEVGDDRWLGDRYSRLFEEAADGREGLAAHLRFQQAVNLPGLLQRLDSATMLESVEGRVPFADAGVLAVARGQPIERCFEPSGATVAERTKRTLRAAFARAVPGSVLRRDKASFPVPFQQWMGEATRDKDGVGMMPGIRTDGVSRLISPAALALVRAKPAEHWNLAWPILNLWLWAERWWGDGPDGRAQPAAASTRGTAASSRFV